MGEANERRSRGLMESFSLEKYPRDLLQRFMCADQQSSLQNAAFRGGEEEEEEEEEEDLELNLGLSLGGRFGVDKTKSKKLTRSSSIVGTMPIARDSDDSAAVVPPVSYPALVRTSSLPTETEEEWRKRKELQTLRRMAAKRRRSEKQRNSAASSGKAEREDEERDRQRYLAALRAPIGGGGGADLMSKTRQPSSQGSVESHGGGSSSGMSELESITVQGSSSYGEARSPAGHQSLQERSQEIMGPSGTKTTENKCSTSGSKTTETPSRKPNPGGNKGREIGMNAMEDMPCVFTKGDGPNGRRIDGILYRYGKGEDVRIMCVCHGNFLSPAEFVKHAGGGDVDHPLRHIVINPSSTSLLS